MVLYRVHKKTAMTPVSGVNPRSVKYNATATACVAQPTASGGFRSRHKWNFAVLYLLVKNKECVKNVQLSCLWNRVVSEHCSVEGGGRFAVGLADG